MITHAKLTFPDGSIKERDKDSLDGYRGIPFRGIKVNGKRPIRYDLTAHDIDEKDEAIFSKSYQILHPNYWENVFINGKQYKI